MTTHVYYAVKPRQWVERIADAKYLMETYDQTWVHDGYTEIMFLVFTNHLVHHYLIKDKR